LQRNQPEPETEAVEIVRVLTGGDGAGVDVSVAARQVLRIERMASVVKNTVKP
jgi:hypothetical protein